MNLSANVHERRASRIDAKIDTGTRVLSTKHINLKSRQNIKALPIGMKMGKPILHVQGQHAKQHRQDGSRDVISIDPSG